MAKNIKDIICKELELYDKENSNNFAKLKSEISEKDNEIKMLKAKLLCSQRIELLSSQTEESNTMIFENNTFIVGINNLEKVKEEAIFDAINYFMKKCAYCEVDLYSTSIRHKIEIDHFYPIAKGGQDVPWNIIPVCKSCNRTKSKKMPYDYLDINKYTIIKNYLETVKISISNNSMIDAQELSLIKNYLQENINEIRCYKQISPILELAGIKNYDYSENSSPDKENIVFEFFKTIQSKGYNKCYWYYKKRNIFYISIPRSYKIYFDIYKGKTELELKEIRSLINEVIPDIKKSSTSSMNGEMVRVSAIKLIDIDEPFKSFFDKFINN